MGRLSRWIFVDYVLIEVCLFPNISDSSHVAVDVQSEEILVIVKAINLFDAFNKIIEIKTKRISDIIQKAFAVALKDGLTLTAHLFHQLAEGLNFLETSHDAHSTVNCQVAQP